MMEPNEETIALNCKIRECTARMTGDFEYANEKVRWALYLIDNENYDMANSALKMALKTIQPDFTGAIALVKEAEKRRRKQ